MIKSMEGMVIDLAETGVELDINRIAFINAISLKRYKKSFHRVSSYNHGKKRLKS